MGDRAILVLRWLATILCPVPLGLALLYLSFEAWRVVTLVVYPEDDVGSGAAKELYGTWVLVQPVFIGLVVAFAVGVLAPKWKLGVVLLAALAPAVLHAIYVYVSDLPQGAAHDPASLAKSAGLILGAALGCGLVYKVYGHGKEAQ